MPSASNPLLPQTRTLHVCATALCVWICTGCEHLVRSTTNAVEAVELEPLDLAFDAAVPLIASFDSPSGRSLQIRSFGQKDQQVIRFTATEHGRWSYRVAAGSRLLRTGTIDVASSDAHGFVRVRGRSFFHEDGTPVIVLGENRINIYDPQWNWNGLSAQDYLRHMADHGIAALRVFIVSDIENEQTGSINPGVLEPALGQFDPGVAERFDQIMRTAQALDIQVILVAFALGFSPDDEWKSWQDNPYSLERGGPAQTHYDFFESAAARSVAARRIEYLAARYAPFPNLLSIDLLNEPEWDGGIPEASWHAWAREMSRIWDEADPYEHPVTLGSVGLHWNIEGDEREWWSSDACDVVQWHLYGKEVYDVHALAAEMTRKIRETWSHGKPILVGEFAYGDEPKPAYDHTHVGLWSAAFSGAGVLAHSAPPFNPDSDELMTPDRALHYRVLRQTLAALPEHSPTPVNASHGVASWLLMGKDAGAIWLLAPKDNYDNTLGAVSITMPDVPAGSWSIEWLDDVSGEPLGSSLAHVRDGRLQAAVPPFRRHVLGRLRMQ